MKSGIHVLCVALFVAAQFSGLTAEEDLVVVSGAKIEESQSSASEKVHVIGEEELKKSGAKTLADAFKFLPGLIVSSANSKSSSSCVMMQGFEGQYVKVLVDGVSLPGDSGGSVYLERYPVENIDHIEVVQGASSALFGSDAMGGVINIITKKQKTEEKTKVGGYIGEEFSSDIRNFIDAGIGLSLGKFTSSFSASYDWQKGITEKYFDSTIGSVDETKIPNSRLGFLDGCVGWNSDSWNLSLSGFYSDYERESTSVGISKKTKYIADTDYFERRGGISLSANKDFSDEWSISAFVSGKRHDVGMDEVKRLSTTASSNKDAEHYELETEVRASWIPNLYNRAVVGFNGKFEKEYSSYFDGSKNQVLLSLFAQNTIDVSGGDEKLMFVLGERLDFQPKEEDGENYLQGTPKISIVFKPVDLFAARLSYGMGFKVPSLMQKYYVFYHSHGNSGFYIYGNEDLLPEISHGFNLTFDHKIGNKITVWESGFFNYHKDMIDTEKVTSGRTYYYQYKNIGEAITFGANLGISAEFDRFTFKTGYAFTGAKQIEDDEFIDLTYRVPHRVTASFSYLIPLIETQIYLNGEWNAPQLISADDDTYSPDCLLLSAGANKKFRNEMFEVYCRAENILNNAHFIEGSEDESQEDFFALYKGFIFTLGGKFRF